MQTFPEVLGDGLEEFIYRTAADEHLLAVGGDRICSVSEHPVEAAAASHHVLAGRLVEDVYHIVAVSSGESVLHRAAAGEFATHHEVVTFLGRQVVGAKAALNGIITFPAHQV